MSTGLLTYGYSCLHTCTHIHKHTKKIYIVFMIFHSLKCLVGTNPLDLA